MNQHQNSSNSFDGLNRVFQKSVYDSLKGKVRLEVHWADLNETLPFLKDGGLRILDAAGGMGHFARRLAAQGHQVVLIDLSEDMLTQARLRNQAEGLENLIELHRMGVHELEKKPFGDFDLVLFHGAIAWIQEQYSAMSAITANIKPGGYFSFLYYNKDRLILKNGVNGRLARISSGHYKPNMEAKRRKRLTPPHPLCWDETAPWYDSLGLDILSRAGIRIFYDLTDNRRNFDGQEDELLKTEKLFSRRHPFWQIGQHIHVVCRRRISE